MKEELGDDKCTDEEPLAETYQTFPKAPKTDMIRTSSHTPYKKKFTGERKKRVRKKLRKPIIDEHEEEDVLYFNKYANCPLTDNERAIEACVFYAQGKLCGLYVRHNYREIKEYNRSNCERQQKAELDTSEKNGQEAAYDEYGVPNDNQGAKSHNSKGYTGGIKR